MLSIRYIEITETHYIFPAIMVWFTGCHFNCKNCFNKDLQTQNIKDNVLVDDLIIKLQQYPDINTIIYSGGEPLDQDITELIKLSSRLKKLGYTIICFTGYNYKKVNKQFRNLRDNIDCFIAGQYLNTENGLENKHILTNDYNIRNFYEGLKKNLPVEVTIKDGVIKIMGFKEI